MCSSTGSAGLLGVRWFLRGAASRSWVGTRALTRVSSATRCRLVRTRVGEGCGGRRSPSVAVRDTSKSGDSWGTAGFARSAHQQTRPSTGRPHGWPGLDDSGPGLRSASLLDKPPAGLVRAQVQFGEHLDEPTLLRRRTRTKASADQSAGCATTLAKGVVETRTRSSWSDEMAAEACLAGRSKFALSDLVRCGCQTSDG